MTQRASVHRMTDNCPIITDCSNEFNAITLVAVLAEAPPCVPGLSRFIAKCYGERPTPVFLQTDSGERRNVAGSSGLQHGNTVRL